VDTKIPKNLNELVQPVRYFKTLSQDLRNGTANFALIHGYVRKWISDMKCFSMSLPILNNSNILDVLNSFFRWILANGVPYQQVPQDICYDLEWLKRKWQKGDWDLSDCLRGISVDSLQLSRSLDKEWKFLKDWRKFGHHGLIVGETWPHQIAILRDGGHGSPEGGIAGIKGEGATSIVLSDPENREDYADIDEGYKVEYVSTASKDEHPTRSTQLLLDSHEWRVLFEKTKVEEGDEKEKTKLEDRPIRLFRSWRLSEKNTFRPRSGFRYDGLYDITARKMIDPNRALYRFTIERRDDQGPIRTDQPDKQMCTLYYQLAGIQKAAKRKYQSSSGYGGRNTRRRSRR
jgi:SAD/SRA domain